MTNSKGYTLTSEEEEEDEAVSSEQLDADIAEALAEMKQVRAGKVKLRETIIERKTPAEREVISSLFAELLSYANSHMITEEDEKIVQEFNARIQQAHLQEFAR